jgi:ATP-dependent helicase/nuclease subunit A
LIWGKAIRRYVEPQTATPKSDADMVEAPSPELPVCLNAPAQSETAVQRLSPSQLADKVEAIANDVELEQAAYSPVASGDRFFRGNVLHKLFELLPEIALNERDEATRRMLEKLAPDIAPEERGRWRAEVLTVLNDSIFADVFGPNSRAETPIGGRPAGIRADAIISGQIDRLVVAETRVLAVDYKTNRPPPKRVEDTPLAYLSQMAAYRALLREIFPGRDIEMALLWTFEARLTVLPEKLLDQAFARTLA